MVNETRKIMGDPNIDVSPDVRPRAGRFVAQRVDPRGDGASASRSKRP